MKENGSDEIRCQFRVAIVLVTRDHSSIDLLYVDFDWESRKLSTSVISSHMRLPCDIESISLTDFVPVIDAYLPESASSEENRIHIRNCKLPIFM